MIKKGIFLFYIVASSLTFAQSIADQVVDKYESRFQTSPREFAFMQINDRIFYNGGAIAFTIDLFSEDFLPSGLSKVVYLDLIHESGLFHEKYAFNANQGRVKGTIDLPVDVPTGNYQLVAYTNYMRNFDLEKCSYRLPLYIQNTLERPSSVVELMDGKNDVVPPSGNLGFSVAVENRDGNYFARISSVGEQSGGEYYLISEGLNQIQFVAKLDIQAGEKTVKIPQENLWGSFQKLVLIDRQLNVLAAIGYIRPVEKWSATTAETLEDDPRLVTQSNERLHAKLKEHQSVGERQSGPFFIRLAELYFGIPRDLIAESPLSTAAFNQFLQRNSDFTREQWTGRWNNSMETVTYVPEEGIRITGRIEADEKTIKKSIVVANFFQNRLDIISSVSADGEFTVDVGIPIVSDLVFLNVIDDQKRSLDKDLSVLVDPGVEINYQSAGLTYFDRSMTDSLLNQHMEFNYALSTFSNFTVADRYFWKDLPYDREMLIDDYRTLEDFEQFVREAMPSTTIATVKGKKQLQMFDHVALNMAKPSMIVLNNTVLRSDSLLFEIPLEDIKLIRSVHDEVTLRKFGSGLSSGIFIVETKRNVAINPSEKDSSCVVVTGFTRNQTVNKVAERFRTSEVLYLSERRELPFSIPQKGSWDVLIERLGSSGNYQMQQLHFDRKN